jgi:hypothetical protein
MLDKIDWKTVLAVFVKYILPLLLGAEMVARRGGEVAARFGG